MQIQKTTEIANKTAKLYKWLDEEIERLAGNNGCMGCGDCCKYAQYGHRIYVTSPEIIFLQENLKTDFSKMELMDGTCPFQKDDKCSIRQFRFSPCRIYFCRLEENWQNQLSEQFLQQTKALCNDFDIEYRYIDLGTALKQLKNAGKWI